MTTAANIFRKDVIRSGRFFVPNLNAWLDVTPERMDGWVASFAKMQANGVSADLTTDHEEVKGDAGALSLRDVEPWKAEAKRGVLTKLERVGDVLFMETNIPDAAGVKLVNRCPEVSLEMERGFRDGKGNEYGEAITAVTICRKPVVPGQGPFQRIAASRGQTSNTNVFWIDAHRSADAENNRTTKLSREPATMLTAEQITAARKALNVGADVADAQLDGLLLAKVNELQPIIADNTAKLSRLTTENTTLTGQVTELSKGKAPEVDVDALEEAAETVTVKLSALADKGKLTPAALKVATEKLVGVSGKRPKLSLSRKAATHAGLEARVADVVIEILTANDPVELAKIQGERTKGQTIELSRSTPGGTDDAKELDALAARTKQYASQGQPAK